MRKSILLAVICLCSFSRLFAQPCIPSPGYCPAFDSTCSYKPINYYTFDNDCSRYVDCIDSKVFYIANANANGFFNSGAVDTGFKAIVNPGHGRGNFNFPTRQPALVTKTL